MNENFEIIDCHDDVISFYEPEQTFKLGKLSEKIKQQFNKHLNSYSSNDGLGFIVIDSKQFYSRKIN